MRNVIGALLFAGAAFSAACSSGDDDDDNDSNGFQAPAGGQCAARTGAYTLHFVERSGGDCGAIPDQVVVSGGMQDPACQGGPVDADTCTITSQVTCSYSDGTRTSLAGQIKWNAASTMASGVWQLTLTDTASNVLCQSTYDVTASR
jgi:hypothetical protein